VKKPIIVIIMTHNKILLNIMMFVHRWNYCGLSMCISV
jgi:hypothetical protein